MSCVSFKGIPALQVFNLLLYLLEFLDVCAFEDASFLFFLKEYECHSCQLPTYWLWMKLGLLLLYQDLCNQAFWQSKFFPRQLRNLHQVLWSLMIVPTLQFWKLHCMLLSATSSTLQICSSYRGGQENTWALQDMEHWINRFNQGENVVWFMGFCDEQN